MKSRYDRGTIHDLFQGMGWRWWLGYLIIMLSVLFLFNEVISRELDIRVIWDPVTEYEDESPVTVDDYVFVICDQPIADAGTCSGNLEIREIPSGGTTMMTNYEAVSPRGSIFIRGAARKDGIMSAYSNQLELPYTALAPKAMTIRLIIPGQ